MEGNLKLRGIISFRIRILEWEQFAEGSLETLWVLLMIVLLALTVGGGRRKRPPPFSKLETRKCPFSKTQNKTAFGPKAFFL